VLGRATLLVATGLILGGVGSSIVAGSIRAFLFDVRPHEPAVFLGVGIVIAATGLVAAWMPARWAARVDPIIAIRQP
jgi:ABC-type antimicrobial peptide transport system permease subunit